MSADVHELSIAQSLLEASLEAAAPYAQSRVRVVRVRIGQLRQIIEGTLREAFALCAETTVAEGAKLEIEWLPTVWRCGACDRIRDVETAGVCPCGDAEARDRLEGSDDLVLTSIDLDEPNGQQHKPPD